MISVVQRNAHLRVGVKSLQRTSLIWCSPMLHRAGITTWSGRLSLGMSFSHVGRDSWRPTRYISGLLTRKLIDVIPYSWDTITVCNACLCFFTLEETQHFQSSRSQIRYAPVHWYNTSAFHWLMTLADIIYLGQRRFSSDHYTSWYGCRTSPIYACLHYPFSCVSWSSSRCCINCS